VTAADGGKGLAAEVSIVLSAAALIVKKL